MSKILRNNLQSLRRKSTEKEMLVIFRETFAESARQDIVWEVGGIWKASKAIWETIILRKFGKKYETATFQQFELPFLPEK